MYTCTVITGSVHLYSTLLYHQAWAAQAEGAGPGLSLVEEAGVAHIVMGGNNVVDMFDFQVILASNWSRPRVMVLASGLQ